MAILGLKRFIIIIMGTIINYLMMKRALRLILSLKIMLLVSCNGFGSIDRNVKTKDINVSPKAITGNWGIDYHSYKYLSSIKKDSITIIFNPDSTFELNSSYDLFNNVIENEVSKGNWKIINQNRSVQIELSFNDKMFKNLEVYKKGENYQLWYFFSDPDTGERLLFLKK